MTPAAWRDGVVGMTAVPLSGEVGHERARGLLVTGGENVSRKDYHNGLQPLGKQ